MPIKHFYSLSQGDGTATSVVRPTDWNSAHSMAYSLAGNTLTNLNSTVSGTDIVFAASGDLSVGGTNGSIVFSAQQPVVSYFNPNDGLVQVAGQIGAGSLHMQPAQFPDVVFDRIGFPINYTNATNSTGSITLSLSIGFYTRNVSTLSLYTSFGAALSGTHSGTVQSSVYGGVKLAMITLAGSTSIGEGQYYVGIMSRTTTVGANATVSNFLASQVNSNFDGIFGVSRAATNQYTRGLGTWSTTSTAMPDSVALSHITGTGSIVLRRPIFYVVSGTF
jgi:hypothetical protein